MLIPRWTSRTLDRLYNPYIHASIYFDLAYDCPNETRKTTGSTARDTEVVDDEDNSLLSNSDRIAAFILLICNGKTWKSKKDETFV